jgi:DNA-binding transcriptional LysR family regulator
VQAEIELRKMWFVVAVAEERNFSRAASRCNITQPALSRRVQEVEEALGAKLFERQTRWVRVTKAGKLFVREARRTLEQSRRTVSLVQAFAKQQASPIVIGLSSLSDLPRLYILVERAQRSTSAVTVSVHTAYTPQLISGLLRGDVDLAVVDLPKRVRGVRFHPIAAEPLVVVIPEKLNLSKQSTVQFAELKSAPLVLLSPDIDPGRATIDQALSSAGARAFKVHDAASIPELLDEVAVHGRLGVLRQSATRFQRQGVVYKSLDDTIRLGDALAWRADDRRPALMSLRDSFIAFSRQP